MPALTISDLSQDDVVPGDGAKENRPGPSRD